MRIYVWRSCNQRNEDEKCEHRDGAQERKKETKSDAMEQIEGKHGDGEVHEKRE